MTSNQIEYGKLQEMIRNNKMNNYLESQKVAETKRHNVSSEYTANVSAQEQIRHNKAGEYNAFATLEENKRHNMAMENLQDAYQSEINRHNIVTESQGWTQVNSQAALNYANASLSSSNVGVAGLQTQYNYELGLGNLEQSQRSNDINEYNATTRRDEFVLERNKFYEQRSQNLRNYLLNERDVATREKAQRANEVIGWANFGGGFFNNAVKMGTAAIGG